MPKITRFLQKIFAGNYEASPTGQIAKFGSLAAGGALYTSDPATIQSLPAWLNGWSGATVGSKSPTFQDFNAFQYLVTRQLAYLLQAGIPEYDATTTYYIGSWCQVAGIAYVSVVDNNTGNAVANPTYWTPLKSYLGYATVATSGSYPDLINKPADKQLCKAWVRFNGSNPGYFIEDSYNISGLVRNGVGDYTLTFSTAMPNASYCAVMSATGIPAGTSLISASTTQVRVAAYAQGPGYYDAVGYSLAIFGT